MDKEIALCELQKHVKNYNIVKHCIAVSAIMSEVANVFGEKKEKWSICGLLHDIDYDLTMSNPERHGLEAENLLSEFEVDESIIYAIKSHNDATGVKRKRKMDQVLYSADPISGLITACALILPSKKLADVTTQFVLKKMNELNFAKGADRNKIKKIEKVGIDLEKFVTISLNSMQAIANELGL